MTSLNGQRDTGDRNTREGQEGAMLQKPEHSLQFKVPGCQRPYFGTSFSESPNLPALIFVGISQRM